MFITIHVCVRQEKYINEFYIDSQFINKHIYISPAKHKILAEYIAAFTEGATLTSLYIAAFTQAEHYSMATFIGSRIFARITVVYLCHFTSSIALCLRRAKRIKLKRSLISEVKCAMLYTFLTIYATRSWQCYILVMCDGTNFTQTYVSGEVWNGAI